MLFLVTGAELGGTVAIWRVTMEDGTEPSLLDHLRDGHQKGTSGFTEDYLVNLHSILHQRNHEPEAEHTHPDADKPAEPGEHGEPAQA
jgi:hypothetical protein